ncbi:MAG: DUF3226 domain-containing protein [Scytonema sp. PMC 1069.18]|nr:DUF3226 domain-containing protein [Scytonema sp. PMC 1069.18]MEC4880637.1 DUF3226 domain-containing protein [Scytonema sp. PMC 1070.18]
MSDICKQDTNKVLLVEGSDDCHVVMALCAAHQVPETFGLYECNGDTKVLKRLNALIVRPNPPKVIGVMLDADSPSLDGRWESIKSKLSHYSYKFPNIPDLDGTIVNGHAGEPKLGFWLMPNNKDSGKLEDFCAELAKPRALAFARECVEEAKAKEVTTFKAIDVSKAVIYTYLAWQDEPGRPLGQAITKQALRPHTDIAIRFTNWLTRLFA